MVSGTECPPVLTARNAHGGRQLGLHRDLICDLQHHHAAI